MKKQKVYFKKDCFYGIYGIRLVWHGEGNDPELIWHGKPFNYYHVETPLWENYTEECTEMGIKPNEDDFPVWVKKNARLARELLQNLLDCECFYGC
jgi:hypothetical protein